MGPISIEECGTCKSPTKETNRGLCATCLNRNLQRACESVVLLRAPLPQQRFCRGPARRALFPGMPRALLGPVNSEEVQRTTTSPPFCTSKTTCAGNITPVSSFGVKTPDIKEADPPSLRESLKDSHEQESKLTHETTADGRCLADGEAPGNELRLETKGAEERGSEEKGGDKWHFFQIERNLTVRIPHPPIDSSIRAPGRYQPLVVPSKDSLYSLPARKEIRPKQGLRPSNVKRPSIRPNVNAEAELMMRLLAESMPILKYTAPLVLPPCKVRPAPVSPISPPGDPLWKRRSVTCPKSLKVQVTSICVS